MIRHGISALLSSLLLLFCTNAPALNLSQVHMVKLPNGLTVMILEDHTLPLVSTQVLYKVGGRNECAGATGLAHFVEHMAFRATKNFPDTKVVSRIYGVGGEWHGYTWIDQTTYFETVPVKYLDLVLQIQADRMASIVNNPDEIEAERGAVMTELHSYENDPASLLYDAVLAVSFEQHPYRYNVIGWTSDVEKITHDDIEAFYHRFYKPSNAVLAISGDVDTAGTLKRVQQAFGAIPAGDPVQPPRTVEPPQNGERRVVLRGSGPYQYFQISYRAPAARHPDYPAFLVLQGLLTGSGGVNFEQRGSGETARKGTRLYGIAPGIASFFQPTADPYALDITGHVETSVSTSGIEDAIEKQMARLRDQPAEAGEIDTARKQLLTELVFDVETTENATHQMAFFEGIGAFDVLQRLPGLVASVTAADVQRVAQTYLQPYQRTIGWYLPDGKPVSLLQLPAPGRAIAKHTASPAAGPKTKVLKNRAVAIVQSVSRTPTGFLRIVIPTNTVEIPVDSSDDTPLQGRTSIEFRFLKEDLTSTVQTAAALWANPFPGKEKDPAGSEDPETRLGMEMNDLLGVTPRSGSPAPELVAVAGDVDEQAALSLLEKAFGSARRAAVPAPAALHPKAEPSRVVRLPGKPQSQLGYAVVAAPPASREWYAWRMLMYILSHGYEGRLGVDLISRKGLVYYIDANYETDGRNGWITMTTGVNPDRLEATKQRFTEILQDLKQNPPTDEEVAEAKQHLIGRRLTGYQSDEELTERYAREWLVFGRLLGQSEFEKDVNAVTLQQVRSLVPAFLNGSTVVVDTR